MKGLFVTGTDTDCGKTVVACALARGLRARGFRVAPFKPVAAGARRTATGLRNADAEALIAACGGGWDYARVNPLCFESPVSPHLAAAEAGVVVSLPPLLAIARELAGEADLLLAEGAGGWLVPLGPGMDIADLAAALGLPVVLVVGLRLGCINHARLSARALQASGLPLAGWIGSVLDPQMARLEENIATLEERLPLPALGVLPHGADPAAADAVLDWERLLAGLDAAGGTV